MPPVPSCWPAGWEGHQTGSPRRQERPRAAHSTPRATRPQTRVPAAATAVQPLVWLRTIQKRVPVARATYCSIVDSTLKMRQTRTMRKLRAEDTRSAVAASLPALPRQAPARAWGQEGLPPPAAVGPRPFPPHTSELKVPPRPPAGAHGGMRPAAVKDEGQAPLQRDGPRATAPRSHADRPRAV